MLDRHLSPHMIMIAGKNSVPKRVALESCRGELTADVPIGVGTLFGVEKSSF